jgi:hypothetical protein
MRLLSLYVFSWITPVISSKRNVGDTRRHRRPALRFTRYRWLPLSPLLTKLASSHPLPFVVIADQRTSIHSLLKPGILEGEIGDASQNQTDLIEVCKLLPNHSAIASYKLVGQRGIEPRSRV